MYTWPALFVPPLVFLTLLSVNYALEPVACESQQRLAMHFTAAVSLLIALGGIAFSLRAWRAVGSRLPDDQPDAQARTRFLAVIALMSSVLSTVAIAALWMVQFLIPPCIR